MTEPNFQPRLRSDGTLDPEPLERMGLDWLTGWMRERLSGRDPWFPLDRRSDEDPEMLIVGLLRSLGSGHPLSALLGSAARRLLDEAGSETPYLGPLLRLCQQAVLPATGPWFTSELERLARQPDDFAARWPGRDLTNEILLAALRQSPGWPGNPARPAWEALLARPESATHALSALGTSLEQQASHLAPWWEACPEEERELELSQLIFEALTTEGEATARDILKQAPSLPADLRQAIDQELRANGARPLFASQARRSASGLNSLKEAGFRREHLLATAA